VRKYEKFKEPQSDRSFLKITFEIEVPQPVGELARSSPSTKAWCSPRPGSWEYQPLHLWP